MKNIKIFFLIIAAAFYGCEQEEFPGSGLEGLREFTLMPVPGASIELNSVEPDKNLVIEWNEARSGFDSPVLYTFMFDEEGGDFSSPLFSTPSDNDGTATSITFTNAELEAVLKEELGVADLGETTIIWSVKATNGDVTKIAEPATITLKRFQDAIAGFNLILPSTNSTIELNIDNPDTEVVMDWEGTFSGLGNDITYTFLADEAGGDFSTPIVELPSANGGMDDNLNFTHQQLEEILIGLGVGVAEYYTLDWKVLASGGGLEKESDDLFTLTLRRYNPVATKYLVGAATPGGWGWDNPTEIVEVSEGVFQGTVMFSNETFRLFNVKDDWGSGNNYPYFVGEGYTIDDRFEDALDGDKNFRFTGTPGEYIFTLNTVEKTITLTTGPSKFMVGAATPGGWGWDNPTEMLQVNDGVFVATLNFTNDTFRFFDIEGDWGSGKNYPYFDSEGYTIDANFENALDGDKNFRFIGTPGEYKITLNENNKTITLE